MVETSDIPFKCTVTGQPYVVRLARRDPDNAFVIADYAMIEEAPAPDTLRQRAWKLLPSTAREAVGRVLALPAPPGTASATVGGWLTDITAEGLGMAGFDPEEASNWLRGRRKPAASDGKTITRKASDYLWSGFECPCCGSDSIVRGCECGHFGCQGTVEQAPGGPHWRCSCGWNGYLATGLSDTFEVAAGPTPPATKWLTERPPALPAPETRRLPPPRRMLPRPGKHRSH